MAAITTCPKCYRPVSLPVTDNSAAWVRCPLCRVRYPLQAAADFLPPALEIIAPPFPGEEFEEPAHVGEHAESFRAEQHPFHHEHAFGGEDGDFHGEHAEEGHGEHLGDELGHEHFGEYDEGGGEHDMGDLGAMVQSSAPARKRRKTPAMVLILGLSIFILTTVVGLAAVYAIIMRVAGDRYDAFGVAPYMPHWMVRHNRPPDDDRRSPARNSRTTTPAKTAAQPRPAGAAPATPGLQGMPADIPAAPPNTPPANPSTPAPKTPKNPFDNPKPKGDSTKPLGGRSAALSSAVLSRAAL